MKVSALCTLVLLLAHAPQANASCDEKKADAALEVLFRALRNNGPAQPVWPALLAMVAAHPGCDDGYFAEGYSDFVCRVLGKRWQEAPLVARSFRSPKIREFALRHLDSTCDSDDLLAAQRNAREACPRGLRATCKAIEKATATALREVAESAAAAPAR
jgi:hypothetical protein